MNAISESRSVFDFAQWWLKERPFNIPEDSLTFPKGFSGFVWFRDGQFQVQLFMGQPGTRPPHHTHPNVDSIEYLICGDIDFESERQEYAPGGVGIAHVDAGELHGATVGARGVCFYSIQKWLNGIKPTSVEDDWTGPELDDAHMARLTAPPQ